MLIRLITIYKKKEEVISVEEVKMMCPRCGIDSNTTGSFVNNNDTITTVRCSQCRQVLTDYIYEDGQVLWRLCEGDPSVFEPFSYSRALIVSPGTPQPVTMNKRINQYVCEYIRRHFVPRDSDVWLATYPKSGTSK